MKRVGHKEIVEEFVEYAVEYSINDEDGFIILCNDEEEARLYRATLDGKVVVKTVYETAWAEIDEEI